MNDKEKNLKVLNLIKILKSVDDLYTNDIVKTNEIKDALKELREILQPYKNQDIKSFLYNLKSCIWDEKSKSKGKIDMEFVEKMNYDDFVIHIKEEGRFSKKELIYLANKFLNMPKSQFLKLNNQIILDTIRRHLDNRETVKSIERRASE